LTSPNLTETKLKKKERAGRKGSERRGKRGKRGDVRRGRIVSRQKQIHTIVTAFFYGLSTLVFKKKIGIGDE